MTSAHLTKNTIGSTAFLARGRPARNASPLSGLSLLCSGRAVRDLLRKGCIAPMEKRKLNDIDGSVLARAGAACVIHDLLHAFTTIPTTVRPELLLTNEELSVELLRWPMGLCNGFADAQTGKNGRHPLVGLLRQSVFGRLAGYEDVNDAEPAT